MNYFRIKILLVLASLVLILVACGGGSSSSVTPDDTRITTSGSITGFGSIFVNGVRFHTGSTSISIDDNPGVESDLALGMIVTVNGSLDDNGMSGQADTISFDDSIEGPVDGPIDIDADNQTKTFTILGQNVIVDRNSTVFDDTTFDTIAIGDVLEVSGFVDSFSKITATRVERKGVFNGNTIVELKGRISSLDTTGRTFSIGTAPIIYDTSTAFDDMSESDLTDGLFVEVKGSYDGNAILASKIDRENSGFGSNISKVSIEGLVSDYLSDSSFNIQGQQIDASSAVFEPVSLVLANGIKVEAEGPVENGVLNAIKVKSRSGKFKFETLVESVDPSTGLVTLKYTNANGGQDTVSVVVTSSTKLEDKSSSNNSLTLAQLLPDEFVEVEARDDGNGNLIAVELQREDDDDRILQGLLDEDALQSTPGSRDGSLKILGILFNTSRSIGSNSTDFEGFSDSLISPDEFFAAARQGQLVKIKDKNSGDGTADEVELEI